MGCINGCMVKSNLVISLVPYPSSSRQECWKYFLWYSSTLSTYRALFFRGSLRNFSFLVILVVPLVAYTFSFSSIQHQMVIYDIYARLIFHQFGPNCDHGVALQPQVCCEVVSPFSNNCPNQKNKNATFPQRKTLHLIMPTIRVRKVHDTCSKVKLARIYF